jgi:hypothetical protein
MIPHSSDRDPSRKARIAGWFSGLTIDSFVITSPETRFVDPGVTPYNCIAHAAGVSDRWWWPDDPLAFWPPDAPSETTLDSFIRAFASLGYHHCEDPILDPQFEKIAIYVDKDGSPTHAAIQLENGRWSSKLGEWEDIMHDYGALTGDSGDEYGRIAVIMRREKRPRSPNRIIRALKRILLAMRGPF